MIYIATNVNKTYFETKPGNWIQSVNKYKADNQCCMTMTIGFEASFIENSLYIPFEDIQYSKHPNLKNRPEFVCLESGEFINFYNFNDDDVVILCDWDVTMQRAFTQDELDLILNIEPDKFLMNRGHYPANYLYNDQLNYLNIGNIFNDIDPNWIVYNTGIQVAKVSAWKKLFEYWKIYYNDMFTKCTHHAAGQALFNYIVQKHDMIIEAPLTFHNADWFTGTPSVIKNYQLFVNNDLVLFNHHKFNYLPNF